MAGITLYPGENRGVVRFHDLIPASFKFSGGTPEELEKMQDRPALAVFRWVDGEGGRVTESLITLASLHGSQPVVSAWGTQVAIPGGRVVPRLSNP